MNFKRSARVQELLRHEISGLVQQISNPQLGFVTITAVRLSDDLMDAKVFFSVLGNEEEKAVSTDILIRSVGSIRHDLGRKLESLRKVPHIQFVYDNTAEKAQKVTEILNQLAQERQEIGGSEPESSPAKPRARNGARKPGKRRS